MSIRPIVRLGHPALRTPTESLPLQRLAEPEIQTLIDDMIETMRAAEGVGLAAPQLGLGWQLFVYEVQPEPGQPNSGIPLHVVVNPMVEPEAHEVIYDWEGCLSIPDLRGLVPRHPAVRVRGLDREGKPLDYRAAGFEARVIQHEYDHLNGIVFLDRMRDFQSLAFYREWEEFLVSGQVPAATARAE